LTTKANIEVAVLKESDQGPRKDRDGRRLNVGDVVRVVGVPNLSRIPRNAEMKAVFGRLVGQDKRITAFEWGEVRLDFRILRGKYRGYHAVWIEPHLVRRRTRPAP
jgi:hypothetical protein